MTPILSRRRLMTAAGSAVFLQTFVKALDATAQSAAPKRIVFINNTNGTSPRYFTSPGWTTSSFPLRDMLLPLASFQSKMTIINNLNFGAIGAGLHGSHGMYTGTDSFIPAGSTKGLLPQGPSIDQYLGARIGMGDPFSSVALCDAGNVGAGSYDALGQPVRPIGDANAAFTALFGSGTGSGGGTPTPDPSVARKQRLFDYTKNEIRALQSKLVGAERAKLEQYIGGIEDLEKQLKPTAPPILSCAKPQPPSLPPSPTKTAGAIAHANWQRSVLTAQFRVMAQALQCGLTRVGYVGISAPPPSYEVVDASGNIFSYHNGAQHGGNQPRIQEQNAFWMESIATFWKLLESAPEAGGTVADSTLLVWMPCTGEHHNGSFNIPVIVLGNLKGAIQSGRHLRYAADSDPKNKSPHTPNDFFTSLCNLMGAPTAKFGDPKYCSGPLPQFA